MRCLHKKGDGYKVGGDREMRKGERERERGVEKETGRD